jgi:hypothetical protein
MENIKNMMQKAIKDAGTKELGNFSSRGLDDSKDISNMLTNITKMQREVSEEEYNEFFEELEGEESKEEAKEATGAGSAGGYESPLFSEPKKNNLFQPGTESKLTTKPKGGPVNEDEIPGGLAKGMSLKDIEKKHGVESLKDELEKGIETELEHTTSEEIAKEIAMDHLFEDPKYYTKIKKIEATEATTSASAGVYDAPIGGGRKDPLQIDTPKSVYSKLRSVKDKNFPRYGGPEGKFVKIKDKCKTFPYCNQGDIKALEFFENEIVKEAINNISKRYKIDENYIKGVILENTNIYYKSTDMNKEIENMIDGIVDKVLSEEVTKKAEQITESVSGEIDEMEEYYEIAKRRKEDRAKFDGRDSEVIGVDSDIQKQRKEMGEEELGEDSFNYVAALAKVDGKKEFEFGGEKHPVEMDIDTAKRIVGDVKDDSVKDDEDQIDKLEKDVKSDEKKEKEVKKESVQLSEEEMIDLIEKIIEEQKISGGGKIEGVTSQNKAMKTSEKETNEYHKDLMKKFKDYLKDGSKGEFNESPTDFPKGNGELEKMEKKAYTPSDSVEEYIDQIARSGGMENLDYDQIKPDEEWLDKNIVGSSETGNSDEYANAVATDVNKNVKKRKDLDILNKLKKQSYEKAPQPVFDMAGENTHKDVMDLGESKEDKKQTKINEDLERMKNLISHNYKSQ